MHIVLTDSGVGGLSVCAYAERFVRTRGAAEPVRLTFVNAAPDNDYGYNSMPSRDVQLRTFERFLATVTARYAPDLIYVACNTLSVLLPDVPQPALPVTGIIETGVELVARELEADPRSAAILFATPTTIAAGTHRRLIEARGAAASRIVGQACPGLADTISEDRDGAATAAAIARWVAAATEQLPGADTPVVACLACTHYGYRRELFASALAAAGRRAAVVDPNERAVDELLGPRGGASREVSVEVVTRYAIPEAAVETLAWFLDPISQPTVAALRSFVHLPDLF
jgi:glutamate racemase